jgi:hypothetical protein
MKTKLLGSCCIQSQLVSYMMMLVNANCPTMPVCTVMNYWSMPIMHNESCGFPAMSLAS